MSPSDCAKLDREQRAKFISDLRAIREERLAFAADRERLCKFKPGAKCACDGQDMHPDCVAALRCAR